MFIGTACFRSHEELIKYFEKEGNNKESIQEYINEGLVKVGFPPEVDSSRLQVVEGRFFYKECNNE